MRERLVLGIMSGTSLDGVDYALCRIDLATRALSLGKLSMDPNGAWAARGRPCEPLLRRLLKHDYFRQKPPKSTGRGLFGEPFFKTAMRDMRRLRPEDKMATLTEFTARSLALNYRLHLPSPPSRLILTGGGAANPHLGAGHCPAIRPRRR